MNNRIPPSEKISKEIKELIGELDQRFSKVNSISRSLRYRIATKAIKNRFFRKD